MSQTFSIFQKNIEKVWNIEILKSQGKNNRVPTFLYGHSSNAQAIPDPFLS